MFHTFFFWPFVFWAPFHGLISLLVIVLVLSLIFRRRHYYYGGVPRSEALAILEGRYARGEIQRDEYLQKKQDLGG